MRCSVFSFGKFSKNTFIVVFSIFSINISMISFFECTTKIKKILIVIMFCAMFFYLNAKSLFINDFKFADVFKKRSIELIIIFI